VKAVLSLLHVNMLYCCLESNDESVEKCSDNSNSIDIIGIKAGHKNMLGKVHIMLLFWCIQFHLFNSIRNLKILGEKICWA
jgi:hypothetical protein